MAQSVTTQEVKQILCDWGAKLISIAPAERMANAPRGHRPEDLLPGAKSIISIAVPILDPLVNVTSLMLESEMIPEDMLPVVQQHMFDHCAHDATNYLTRTAAYHMTDYLNERGLMTTYFPTDNSPLEGSEFAAYSKSPTRYTLFSHRHAAVAAGLGTFGPNNLVVTPQYGPRVRLDTILTRAELDYDPVLTKSVCLEGCNICTQDWPECFGERYQFPFNGVTHHLARFLGCRARNIFGKGKATYDSCLGQGCIQVCPIGADFKGVRRGKPVAELPHSVPTILAR